MIKLDYAAMALCASMIKQLSQTAVMVTDPLAESMGNATQEEKEIIKLLQQIGQQELPALFNASSQLITAVSREFREAEQLASRQFEG